MNLPQHYRRLVIAVASAAALLLILYLVSFYRADHNADVANHNKGVAQTAQNNADVAEAFLKTVCHSNPETPAQKKVSGSACQMLRGLQATPHVTTELPPIPGPQGPAGPRGFMGRPGQSIVGPRGAPGLTGPIGPTGKPGTAGQNGSPGSPGRDGSNGSNGTGVQSVDCNPDTNHFVISYTDGTSQSVDNSKCIGAPGQDGKNGQDATFPANNDASCSPGRYMLGVHLGVGGDLSIDCGSLDALCPDGSTFQRLSVVTGPPSVTADIYACVIA